MRKIIPKSRINSKLINTMTPKYENNTSGIANKHSFSTKECQKQLGHQEKNAYNPLLQINTYYIT